MEHARRLTWINRVMFGLLALFVIATLGQALVGAVTLLDVNLLTRFEPWQALHGQDILNTNICRGDTVDSVMPAIAETRSRFLQGDFPGWSAGSVGGFPLAGLPNFGVFSPLSLPYFVMPLWLAPAFVKLGEFVIAIGGMTLFLRRLRLSTASGILAGIVFASSGFMISWTNWPQTHVAAFIPALFWATERLVQRQRPLDSLPLAVVLVSMLLGGFPAVTGMALYGAAFYFVVRIVQVQRSNWRTCVRATLLAVLGLTLGGALSAFQMLPFAKQLAITNLDYRAQGPNNHSQLSSLITTMVPDAQGLCINGASYSRANPIENVAFIGVAAIVLAVVAILISARKGQPSQSGIVGFFGVALVVVVILGWVGGPMLAFAQHFPVFSNNSVSRIRVLLGFLAAVLAGFGFERLLGVVRDRDDDPSRPPHPAAGPDDQLTDQPDGVAAKLDQPVSAPRPRRFGLVPFRLSWPVVVLAATTLFALWVLNDVVKDARAAHTIRHLARVGAIPTLLLVACVASVLAIRSGPRWLRYASIVAIPLIAVVQSASAFRASVPGSNPDNFYAVTSTHRFLQQNLGADRFAASGSQMYPATAPFYGLRSPTGHQFTTDAWKALLHAVDPASSATATFSDFTAKAVNAGTAGHIPILDQMAVRYLVAPDSDIAGTTIDPPATSNTVTLASGQHAKCAPVPGPLRGVTINLAGLLRSAGQAGVTVHATLHTVRGDLNGARYLGSDLQSPKAITVAIPGEDLNAADPLSADIWVSGATGTFALQGNGKALSCGEVAPIQDGLKLVSSEAGAIIYQRLTSLPRIRWASTSSTLTGTVARVAVLKAGISPDAVILDTLGPAASGGPATVRTTTDSGDRIAVTVDAAGMGYLVIADSLQQPGWSATVDGKPVTLVPADNAMVAVPISAGIHQVELSYTVPGQRTGLLVSGGALAVMLGMVALWSRRRRHPGAEWTATSLPSAEEQP